MTSSAPLASSRGVAATIAPAAASAVVFAAVRFHTVTAWPTPNKRPASAAPMRPVPAIPIFNGSSIVGDMPCVYVDMRQPQGVKLARAKNNEWTAAQRPLREEDR